MNKFAVKPYNFSEDTIELLKNIDKHWDYNLNSYYHFDNNECNSQHPYLNEGYTYLTEQEFLNMINNTIYECW